MVTGQQLRDFLDEQHRKWCQKWPHHFHALGWKKALCQDGYGDWIPNDAVHQWNDAVHQWLADNIDPGMWSQFRIDWYGFKNEDDAFAFKLRFG